MNSIAHPCFDPIEYIQDRLYLAAYDRPPSSSPSSLRTTLKKSRSSQQQQQQQQQSTNPHSNPPVYFTVDDTLLYNAFHADFGPLHIAHLYRFAVQFHEILADPANNNRIVVFYSKPDARSRANAACLVACYMVLIQSWPPHLALAPIAQADPPYMPFRDAGYSQADFVLGIQDVVYGVWKAKEEGLCGLREFDLEEYELYERVDMGDFNWITPNFIAFASPQLPHHSVAPIPRNSPAYASLPSSISSVVASHLPLPMKNVLVHFKERDVGLVVRLNSELYCPTYFSALGIQHLDMIFEDGTCPPLPLVKKFISLAHEMITKHNKNIAVHCKAGLGRTGCLIGAYLIYRHGFTANEVISYMRFMRPGMVVGPQQHWLHLNQGTFREWWIEDAVREKVMAQMAATNVANAVPITPARGMKQRLVVLTPTAEEKAAMRNGATTPSTRRPALGEIDNEVIAPAASAQDEFDDEPQTAVPSPTRQYNEDYLPAPTPGQPRKTHRRDSRNHPYARAVSGSLAPRSEELTASGRRRKVSSSMAYLASQGGSPSPRSPASPGSPGSPSPSTMTGGGSPRIPEQDEQDLEDSEKERERERERQKERERERVRVRILERERESKNLNREKAGDDEEVKMQMLAAVKARRVRGMSTRSQQQYQHHHTSSSQSSISRGTGGVNVRSAVAAITAASASSTSQGSTPPPQGTSTNTATAANSSNMHENNNNNNGDSNEPSNWTTSGTGSGSMSRGSVSTISSSSAGGSTVSTSASASISVSASADGSIAAAAPNSAKIRSPTPQQQQSQSQSQSQQQSQQQPQQSPIRPSGTATASTAPSATASATTATTTANATNVLGMSKVRTRRAVHYHHHHHSGHHGHGHGHHAYYDEGRGNTVRSDGKGVRKISGRVGSNGSAGGKGDKGDRDRESKEREVVPGSVGVVAGGN